MSSKFRARSGEAPDLAEQLEAAHDRLRLASKAKSIAEFTWSEKYRQWVREHPDHYRGDSERRKLAAQDAYLTEYTALQSGVQELQDARLALAAIKDRLVAKETK